MYGGCRATRHLLTRYGFTLLTYKNFVITVLIVLYRIVMRSAFRVRQEIIAFIIVKIGTKTIKLDFWEVVIKVFESTFLGTETIW